jgi:hypothetical protein
MGGLKADLPRFSVDRLMPILNRLGSRVEANVRIRRAEPLGCRTPDWRERLGWRR